MKSAATPPFICQADYASALHARALVDLLDNYARDPMGGGHPLSDFAKAHIVQALAARSQAFSVLAFADASQVEPVGLVNCFEGFSTFATFSEGFSTFSTFSTFSETSDFPPLVLFTRSSRFASAST